MIPIYCVSVCTLRKGAKVENSKRIAGLVGPTIVVLAISEALNFHIFADQIAPVVYLNGTILQHVLRCSHGCPEWGSNPVLLSAGREGPVWLKADIAAPY